MANNDVVNLCISTKSAKFGGLVVGVNNFGKQAGRQETYDFKTGDIIPTMDASGVYQTGGPNLSGVAVRLSSRFDHHLVLT